MNDLKLVIFDMAGTTVKDNGEVPDAFTAALADHDLSVTPAQLTTVRGSSKRQAVLHLTPEGPHRALRAEAIYVSFCSRLTQRYQADGVTQMEGATAIFRWLRSRDIRVALNTGFDRDITTLLLTALQWQDDVVDAVICGDDVRQGRPAPYLIFHAMEATMITDVRHVMNIGDTALDLRAAHNARVRWNIGVLSGAHTIEQLEPAPHTHLLPSISALPDLWNPPTS